jgi:hypothetical protein
MSEHPLLFLASNTGQHFQPCRRRLRGTVRITIRHRPPGKTIGRLQDHHSHRRRPVRLPVSTCSIRHRTHFQAIIGGTLLYYAPTVDPSLLPIGNELASKQAQPTTAVMNAASRALSYCAGKPNMATTFYACGMILTVYGCISPRASTALYAKPMAVVLSHRMVVGGWGYPKLAKMVQRPVACWPPVNSAAYSASPADATTHEMMVEIAETTHMRFHWIRDRVRQNQFGLVCIPTKENIADYMIKTLPK